MMAEEKEEREMESLLGEIPQVTAPLEQRGGGGVAAAQAYAQGYGVHGAARYSGYTAPRYGGDQYCPVVINCRDGGAHQGGGSSFFHVPRSGGFAPSPASSTFTGSASWQASNPFVGRATSPMVQAVDDAERLANQFGSLRVGDAHAALMPQASPAPAALMPRGTPVPAVNSMSLAHGSTAHGAYYNFGAPGFSVHHEPVFADQAGYVARSQCFAGDVGLDGYDSFPTRLDTSVGASCTLGQGMAPALVDDKGLCTTVMPGRSCFLGSLARNTAEGYTSTSQIALDARGRNGGFPKSPYGYGVPARETGYMKSGFNQVEAFHSENSQFVDRRKNMPFLNRGNERRFQQYVNNRTVELENPWMLTYDNNIYFMAKHQNGCRFLQQKFEEGKHYVDSIFEGIVDHIAELMTNSFANDLVQKLLDVCDEEQRLRIIAVLAEDPVKMLTVSINEHGSTAMVKLIETVKIRKQIVLIISALLPGFIHIVNDLNGSHVIQKCLTIFGAEEKKFIFESAATHCFGMAINRNGCRILQDCVSAAYGEYQAKLIVEICSHGFQLAQHPFGAIISIMSLLNQYVLMRKPFGPIPVVRESVKPSPGGEMGHVQSMVYQECCILGYVP
ncbi:hypothetical protein ABZP36_006004 [Zizania latifolia]